MTTLKTITTIEVSNICNLTCRYCINRLLVKDPRREPGIMSDEVFSASLKLLRKLCDTGTQQEVWLNGNGESMLDPNIADKLRRTKEVMGDRKVGLCTNGVNLTLDQARQIRAAGIDQFDISVHSPWHARRAAIIMNQVGLPGYMNLGPVTGAHNWAGQLEPENSLPLLIQASKCDPLAEGRGYVSKEGNISPCCYDYRNLGVFGSVFDEDVFTREYGPYELCKTCHQNIMEEKQEAA